MAGTTSGFADGRHEVSPDSEQMEQTATVLLLRNSGSVEQIQDRREEPSRLKTKKEPSKGSFIMAGTTSGFADGRHEVSPDSEQMEQTATVLLLRNSGSVEQIQDRREEPSRLKTKKEPSKGSFIMAGTTRLELATSCVTGMRSNQTELRSQMFWLLLYYMC